MKNILFVSSEAIPFMKTGGLADVVGSLPRYINKEEYDVRVILPKYACMEEKFKSKLKPVCHFDVHLNWRKQYAEILKTEYEGITYYFVENEFYFAGPSPYNQIYEDVEKFAFFSKAVLDALKYIDFMPDVIHCNDWQTGLVPVFLKTQYGSDNFYYGIKTVFSIHNMKFQGRWKINEVADITGLPEHIFRYDKLESYGDANYLKGGIVYADKVTTVSPTYAVDITTPEGGEGLNGLMYARRGDLCGIVNGIDYDEYNPEKDVYISSHFSKKDMLPKNENKKELQKSLELPIRTDAFMIGMVSRMTDQKGFDLVDCMLDEMLGELDIQIVVLGTGEERYENMFRYFQNKYPDKLSAYIGYSEEQAHKIYAACDAFLMPSLFEPCGLSQMMAMRYGTIPIVRETGGLKDTVVAYNEFENTGNGFSFQNYNAHEMYHVIKYAYDVYQNRPKEWNGLMERAMDIDFSWNVPAKEYEKLYDSIITK
ncbi:MAG: glycogen synthase GlgA [Agathobacter sp.]|nr:glycogen synthase GlgA [Agathobacter sp.]